MPALMRVREFSNRGGIAFEQHVEGYRHRSAAMLVLRRPPADGGGANIHALQGYRAWALGLSEDGSDASPRVASVVLAGAQFVASRCLLPTCFLT